MERSDIQKLLAREQFTPFRVYLKNGKIYDVPFVDVVRALSRELLVFIGLKRGTRQAKSYDSFPYDYIERIEERPPRSRRQRKAS